MPDIPLKYLQVEPKEDSPAKLASVAGKPTKWYLFALEFELVRNFINKLRDDIDNSKGFGTKMKRFETTFTGSQIITLPSNYVEVYMIDVQGQGALSSSQYSLIAPNQIEILDELDTNDYIVVMYSEPLGENEDYYTKTQTNNLLTLKVDKTANERLITFSEAEKLNNLSGSNNGDNAVNLTSQSYTDNKITQLVDGATAGGNTLKKLEDKISAINAIIGGTAPDGDTIVDTVAELLEIFQTYPEGTDIASLLAGKVNVSDIVNNLNQLVAGKVLDATQGKVLKDLIDALTVVVGNKVDKVVGKALSENDYTNAEKSKLSGIEAGAQVNPTPWRPNYQISNVTTTSTTYVAIPSMTVNVGAVPTGLWSCIMFSATVLHSNNDVEIRFMLYLNGAQLLTTERRINAHPNRANNVFFNVNYPIVSGNVLEVRWQTVSGTATLVQGSLSIFN